MQKVSLFRRAAMYIVARPGITRWSALGSLASVLCAASRLDAQWVIASPAADTLRVGYLVQTRAEWQGQPDGPTAQNLFLRHLRILLGGRVHRSFSFFIGTDTPNMGKSQPDGTKNNGPMGIYDFWITYEPREAFKLDMGLIGTPSSHNSIQTISGMLASDFGPYSFVSTPPTGSKAGRDYGIQSRGYLLGKHLEYRAGAFQGFRGAEADHELRYTGRVVVDAIRAEQSVYYSGTTLGARRNLALGFSADHQEHYNSVGGDVYVDQPFSNGDVLIVQGDVVRYDGGRTFVDFARQNTWLAEVGYYSKGTRFAPFIQLAGQQFSTDLLADHRQEVVGLAFFARGHKLNIKADGGRIKQTGARASTIVRLSFQAFEF